MKWIHMQSWHSGPYTVRQMGGEAEWSLVWHHEDGGVSHTVRKFPEPAAAMAWAENVHGPDNDWQTYR